MRVESCRAHQRPQGSCEHDDQAVASSNAYRTSVLEKTWKCRAHAGFRAAVSIALTPVGDGVGNIWRFQVTVHACELADLRVAESGELALTTPDKPWLT